MQFTDKISKLIQEFTESCKDSARQRLAELAATSQSPLTPEQAVLVAKVVDDAITSAFFRAVATLTKNICEV